MTIKKLYICISISRWSIILAGNALNPPEVLVYRIESVVQPLLGGLFLFPFVLRLLRTLSSDLFKAFLPRAAVETFSILAHRPRWRTRTDEDLLDVLESCQDCFPVLEQGERYTLTLAVGYKV